MAVCMMIVMLAYGGYSLWDNYMINSGEMCIRDRHTPEFVIPVNVKSDAELITSPSPVIDTTKTGEAAERCV